MPCTQYVLSGPTYHFHHAFITEVQGCWWGRWLSPALLPFVSLTSTPELHFCKQRKQASSWGGVKLSVTFWNGASLKIKGAQWRGWICTFHFLFYLNVFVGFFCCGPFFKSLYKICYSIASVFCAESSLWSVDSSLPHTWASLLLWRLGSVVVKLGLSSCGSWA